MCDRPPASSKHDATPKPGHAVVQAPSYSQTNRYTQDSDLLVVVGGSVVAGSGWHVIPTSSSWIQSLEP